MGLQVMDAAAVEGEAAVKIFAQRRQGHRAEARQQQRLGLVEGRAECGIHRRLDETARRLGPMPDRQQSGGAERIVDVPQGHRRQVAGEPPAAAMPLFGADIAAVPQARHDPPDHHRVGGHRPGQHLGGHRPVPPGHVQQDVQDARQSTVPFHVIINVT